jgi:hypothetical protein
MVDVMNIIPPDTARLVLAQMCLESFRKDAQWYAERAEIEKTPEARRAAAEAEFGVAEYEKMVASLS